MDQLDPREVMTFLEERLPDIAAIIRNGFYQLTVEKGDDIRQIEIAVDLYAKNRGLTLQKREREILVMFLRFGTGNEARKKIVNQLDTTSGSISQYVIKLKKKKILQKKYESNRNYFVDPALVQLKDYIINKGNAVLIKYV